MAATMTTTTKTFPLGSKVWAIQQVKRKRADENGVVWNVIVGFVPRQRVIRGFAVLRGSDEVKYYFKPENDEEWGDETTRSTNLYVFATKTECVDTIIERYGEGVIWDEDVRDEVFALYNQGEPK